MKNIMLGLALGCGLILAGASAMADDLSSLTINDLDEGGMTATASGFQTLTDKTAVPNVAQETLIITLIPDI